MSASHADSVTHEHPGGQRYARGAERHAFFAGIVERCADALMTALGAEDVAGLFMTGAPSRGEATIVETASGLYSLSDVDLVCIASENADLATARVRAAEAVSRLNHELETVCSGVDATVKPHLAAADLPPLISNYEFARTPLLLRGKPSSRELLGEVRIDDIPCDDALRFVHNRCIEQLLAGRSASGDAGDASRDAPEDPVEVELEALRSHYRTAKLMLDLVTAFLFARRRVPVGYEERVRLFVEDYCESPEFEALAVQIRPYLDELGHWVEFKLSGDAAALRSALSETAVAGAHAPPFALAMWKHLLGDVLDEDVSPATLEEAVDRLAAIEGPARSLARSLRTLRDGRRRSVFGTGAVLREALHASPVARAYLCGLVLFFSDFGAEGTEAARDAAPGGSGGAAGGERSRRASHEWTRTTLERYAPFSLPSGFGELDDRALRELFLERLARFHEQVLLGRTPDAA